MFPQLSGLGLRTGDVRGRGMADGSAVATAAAHALATGCPPVIRMSSTMLSTNCAHNSGGPDQLVRACCLMRLVSSVTCV